MRAAITDIEKAGYIPREKVKGPRTGFRSILKKILGWSLLDGDAFLESKDWPYLWKK
jgi:hypothetical protein